MHVNILILPCVYSCAYIIHLLKNNSSIVYFFLSFNPMNPMVFFIQILFKFKLQVPNMINFYS